MSTDFRKLAWAHWRTDGRALQLGGIAHACAMHAPREVVSYTPQWKRDIELYDARPIARYDQCLVARYDERRFAGAVRWRTLAANAGIELTLLVAPHDADEANSVRAHLLIHLPDGVDVVCPRAVRARYPDDWWRRQGFKARIDDDDDDADGAGGQWRREYPRLTDAQTAELHKHGLVVRASHIPGSGWGLFTNGARKIAVDDTVCTYQAALVVLPKPPTPADGVFNYARQTGKRITRATCKRDFDIAITSNALSDDATDPVFVGEWLQTPHAHATLGYMMIVKKSSKTGSTLYRDAAALASGVGRFVNDAREVDWPPYGFAAHRPNACFSVTQGTRLTLKPLRAPIPPDTEIHAAYSADYWAAMKYTESRIHVAGLRPAAPLTFEQRRAGERHTPPIRDAHAWYAALLRFRAQTQQMNETQFARDTAHAFALDSTTLWDPPFGQKMRMMRLLDDACAAADPDVPFDRRTRSDPHDTRLMPCSFRGTDLEVAGMYGVFAPRAASAAAAEMTQHLLYPGFLFTEAELDVLPFRCDTVSTLSAAQCTGLGGAKLLICGDPMSPGCMINAGTRRTAMTVAHEEREIMPRSLTSRGKRSLRDSWVTFERFPIAAAAASTGIVQDDEELIIDYGADKTSSHFVNAESMCHVCCRSAQWPWNRLIACGTCTSVFHQRCIEPHIAPVASPATATAAAAAAPPNTWTCPLHARNAAIRLVRPNLMVYAPVRAHPFDELASDVRDAMLADGNRTADFEPCVVDAAACLFLGDSCGRLQRTDALSHGASETLAARHVALRARTALTHGTCIRLDDVRLPAILSDDAYGFTALEWVHLAFASPAQCNVELVACDSYVMTEMPFSGTRQHSCVPTMLRVKSAGVAQYGQLLLDDTFRSFVDRVGARRSTRVKPTAAAAATATADTDTTVVLPPTWPCPPAMRRNRVAYDMVEEKRLIREYENGALQPGSCDAAYVLASAPRVFLMLLAHAHVKFDDVGDDDDNDAGRHAPNAPSSSSSSSSSPTRQQRAALRALFLADATVQLEKDEVDDDEMFALVQQARIARIMHGSDASARNIEATFPTGALWSPEFDLVQTTFTVRETPVRIGKVKYDSIAAYLQRNPTQMARALRAKFTQHVRHTRLLVKTHPHPLVHPDDAIANRLGVQLMLVREQLMRELNIHGIETQIRGYTARGTRETEAVARGEWLTAAHLLQQRTRDAAKHEYERVSDDVDQRIASDHSVESDDERRARLALESATLAQLFAVGLGQPKRNPKRGMNLIERLANIPHDDDDDDDDLP
jgi:hypothetical protein